VGVILICVKVHDIFLLRILLFLSLISLIMMRLLILIRLMVCAFHSYLSFYLL